MVLSQKERKPSAIAKLKKVVFRNLEKRESVKRSSSFKMSNKGYADVESKHGEYRFKIGVIDFLTKYSNLKYLEN